MSSELAAPFALTPSGGIAEFNVPGDQVQAHLTALVSTAPGERVMLPTYGVPLTKLLFSNTAIDVTQIVAQDVRTAIQKWEPAINLLNVRTMVSDTPEGISKINVDYAPGVVATSNTQVSTATVLVGGTVIGNG